MSCFPFCPHCWMRRVEQTLHRLEINMAKATDQLASANSKVEALTYQFTDFANDVRAALVTINADELSPTAQAQLDQLLGKVDAITQNLHDLDTEVGDRDGSDTPPVEPAPQPEQPVEDEPTR